MHAITRNILVDLVLDNHLSEEAEVRSEDRPALERHLTHVLVNDATRLRHQETLEAFINNNWLEAEQETVDTALNSGLDALTNREMLVLALSSDSLAELAEEIDNVLPKPWRGAVKEEGLRKIRKVKKEK